MLLSVLGVIASAQNQPAPIIDPRADAMLNQMCKLNSETRQFSLDTNTLVDEVTPTGQKIQDTKEYAISVHRPDRLRATVKGDRENFVAVYDGKRVAFSDPKANQYATAPMPRTIDAGSEPLPRKTIIDCKDLPGSPQFISVLDTRNLSPIGSSGGIPIGQTAGSSMGLIRFAP